MVEEHYTKEGNNGLRINGDRCKITIGRDATVFAAVRDDGDFPAVDNGWFGVRRHLS